MDRNLIKYFWNCGDDQIIEFAMMRARLNRNEKMVLQLSLDECLTQEQIAERMDTSTRNIQKIWSSAGDKLLGIDWVMEYSVALKKRRGEA